MRYYRRPTSWPGWIWCIHDDGGAGWVPERWTETDDSHCVLKRDYCAGELAAAPGEIVRGLGDEGGWAMCRDSRGNRGWLPLEKLQEMDLRQAVESSRAVVFDLFHTITSLEATCTERPPTHRMLGVEREAWREQLLHHTPDRVIGKDRDPVEMVRRMAWAIDPTIPDEVISEAVINRIDVFRCALSRVPEPNRKTLSELKRRGKKLGLVSNADVSEVDGWGDSPIAGLFDSVVFSCHAGVAKPEPEIYLRSLRELKLTPDQCLYVGDGGSNELEGARGVDLTTVLVTGDMGDLPEHDVRARKNHADYVIENLTDLIECRTDGK
jgi:putative hydrolase of the HAD superfamily